MVRSLLEAIAQWDTRSSLALQARRARLPNLFFSALSWSGAGGVWFALAGVLMLTHREGLDFMPRQVSFLIAMTAALAALLVGGIIKRMAGRRRPFATERGINAAIWALGVSFSRVWLGVHFPSDVLSGAALGLGFGLLPWERLVQF